MSYEPKYFKVCRVRCKHCGDVLEYENESKRDNGPCIVMKCKCGRIGMDAASLAYRVMVFPLGTFDDPEDLSEEWNEEDEA